jgi:hypothetical protein
MPEQVAGGLTGEEIDARRIEAKRLLEWACRGTAGVSEQDPRYVEVTEGRDFGAGYSSCADLAHWLLYRVGVRSPWINRAEHTGWKTGVNVSRLAYSVPRLMCRTETPGSVFDCGDVLIVWNKPDGTDAHVMVVYEYDHRTVTLTVAEYGQPGGHIKERPLVARNGHLYIGQRQIQRWLPFACVTNVASELGQLSEITYPKNYE